MDTQWEKEKKQIQEDLNRSLQAHNAPAGASSASPTPAAPNRSGDASSQKNAAPNRNGASASQATTAAGDTPTGRRPLSNKAGQSSAAKAPSTKRLFVQTFLIVFLITLVVVTPLFATVNEVILEANPGGEDAPVLALEMDTLIPTDNPFFEAFTNANRVNILLLGVDNHNLTDTIMLASFDMDIKHVDIISIPRDTYYYRGPGYNDPAHHKINAVYRRNPVNTAVAVSETLMNIPINYYALVSYDGVAEIIDSMGGVPMDIPFHMRYNDPLDTPPLRIDIPAGPQVLDGEQSVQFLRYRRGYPEGDLGRVRAQQEFMKSAFRQCVSLDFPKIATTAYNNITSDITLRTALYLATKAIGIKGEDITTYTLPHTLGDVFVHPDPTGIIEMLTEIYSLEAVPEGIVTDAAIIAPPTE